MKVPKQNDKIRIRHEASNQTFEEVVSRVSSDPRHPRTGWKIEIITEREYTGFPLTQYWLIGEDEESGITVDSVRKSNSGKSNIVTFAALLSDS